MENASKALVMAGSVLIALMIIGALLLTFNGIKNYKKSETVDLSTLQTEEFNNQFSTYNRDDVRGNDLYSLLNRAIDFNKRKSTSGDTTDAKEKEGYTPITIKISFEGFVNRTTSNPFSIDGELRLIEKNNYEASGTKNTFEEEINEGIRKIEGTYGQESATKLVKGISKIFIEDDSTDQEKKEAIYNFNKISEKIQLEEGSVNNNWLKIKSGSQIREHIYAYNEYVQFKRAIFKCSNVEYDKTTGRIILMEFKFTGKIQ